MVSKCVQSVGGLQLLVRQITKKRSFFDIWFGKCEMNINIQNQIPSVKSNGARIKKHNANKTKLHNVRQIQPK